MFVLPQISYSYTSWIYAQSLLKLKAFCSFHLYNINFSPADIFQVTLIFPHSLSLSISSYFNLFYSPVAKKQICLIMQGPHVPALLISQKNIFLGDYFLDDNIFSLHWSTIGVITVFLLLPLNYNTVSYKFTRCQLQQRKQMTSLAPLRPNHLHRIYAFKTFYLMTILINSFTQEFNLIQHKEMN